MIKGYVDRVEIICRGEQIAVHRRSYEREDFIANPLHYLALLEHKPRALDQAAPLDGWVLAEPMHRIRRLMEARSGKEGRREFIQVLRLCERFEQPLVEWAVARALEPDPKVIEQYQHVVIQPCFAKSRIEAWHGLVLPGASIAGKGCDIHRI